MPTGTSELIWQPISNHNLPEASRITTTIEPGQVLSLIAAYSRRTGIVIVDVTPNTALWDFGDADGGLHSGTGDAVLLDIPTGVIDFTWLHLVGYDLPSPNAESQTLLEGNTILFLATYSPVQDATWVDFNWTLVEDGTFDNPFNSLSEAFNQVSQGGTVYIKAGTTTETPVISQSVTLEAVGGTVRIGEQPARARSGFVSRSRFRSRAE